MKSPGVLIRVLFVAVLVTGGAAAVGAQEILYRPSSIFDSSPWEGGYTSDNAIDNNLNSFMVGVDDTTPGVIGIDWEPPVTGHVVFNMGTPRYMEKMAIWARNISDSLLPRDVKLFYYENDSPLTSPGAFDDIEGDANIVELWSGTLANLRSAASQTVSFNAPITRQYVGLRVDSSYEEGNFQISEVQFGSGEPIPQAEMFSHVTPQAVYAYSNHEANYTPDKTINRMAGQGGFWVGMDDTVPPDSPPFTGEEPYTGHIVYDFGKTVTLDRAKIFPRTGTQGLGPKGVTFFAFADDDPTHVLGAIDDVEGDPNIVPLWQGEFPDMNGPGVAYQFNQAFTGRYLGVRIDSSYETAYNFQIEEIAFGSAPPTANLLTPAAVYAFSNQETENYAVTKAIDGITDQARNMWVAVNDTPETEPITGHAVFDMGQRVSIDGVKIWMRVDDSFTLGPKNVVFYGFADDDPTNIQGAIDDVEGDPNIVEIWSGDIMGLNYGQADGILFDTTYTGRYIGMRVDDGYEHRFAWPINTFQIGEIAFLQSSQPAPHPGDANADGKVDDLDASILAANWQRTGGAAWAQADFNGDGNVNDLDASILAANWQYGVGAAVPEPAAWVLMLCLAAAGVAARAGHEQAAR